MKGVELELISDKRIGSRLELVIPVLNEVDRIGVIFETYGNIVDIVLLDDGSNDGTIELAQKLGITIFSRSKTNYIGDVHMVLYVNNYSKSGLCFYMFADEAISIEDLTKVQDELLLGKSVYVGRVDWVLCKSAQISSSKIPRGLLTNKAVYDPSELHNNLFIKGAKSDFCPELHHLQVYNIASDHGKVGSYINYEIKMYFKEKHPMLRYSKRFIIKELVLRPYEMFKFRKLGFLRGVWSFSLSMAVFFISVMGLIEKKLAPSVKSQRDFYSRMIKEIAYQNSENSKDPRGGNHEK